MAGTQLTQIACPSCSVVVSTAGERCPECGHWLPTELPSRPAQGAPPRSRPPSQRAPSSMPSARPHERPRMPMSFVRKALPWLAVVATLVLVWVWLRANPSASETASRPVVASAPPMASSAPTPPGDSVPSSAPSDALDPDDALARATAKALEWNRDGQLVEIVVGPVVEGRLDTRAGGAVEIRFGAPAGRRLGPGAPVTADQMLFRVDDQGDHVERVRGPAARSVAPPACGFERAWGAATASGLTSTSPVSMRFALDKDGQRGVWSVKLDGSKEPARVLDGSSCAIVGRR